MLSSVAVVDNLSGFGVYRYGTAGLATLSNCDPWGNAEGSVFGFSDPSGADGNFSEDPAFLSTSPADPLDWDLHLQPGSPLVDAGPDGSFDPDGSPSDIGIYGGPGAALWDLDGDGAPSWWQPGPYDPATYPADGWDCDDADPAVGPDDGC